MIRLAEMQEWSLLFEILFRMEAWKRLLLLQMEGPGDLPVPGDLEASIENYAARDGKSSLLDQRQAKCAKASGKTCRSNTMNGQQRR